jgi:twitching motility protein PilT
MLEQIINDEKISIPKNRKVSQEDIKKMLLERRRLAAQAKACSQVPLEEALVQAGLISRDQLDHALRVQTGKGGKIGSILLELGFISDESLLEFLGKQYGIQSTNLLDIDISEDAISLLPARTILKHKVLPLMVEDHCIHLAMESPNDTAAIQEVELLAGKTVKPLAIPSYQLRLTIKCIEEEGGEIVSGAEIQRALKGAITMQTLFEYLALSQGTDILITTGAPPSVKVNNTLKRSNMPPFTSSQCEACAKALMTKRQWEDFQIRKEIDFSIDYEGKERFRVNAYKQKYCVSLVIRRILDSVLSFQSLGLPEWLEGFLLKSQGLILITAPASQGKTTTLAAMVDLINRRRKCNIITLEDPIEYLHKPIECNINQREIGTDTDTFSTGMHKLLRQAPDVVAISEIRDQETLEGAINAASTGHLVLSTMLSSNATSAIENMLNMMPNNLQTRMRQQLAEALLLVFSQKLVPGRDGDSLVLVYEKLLNSHRIRDYIRENKVHQIRSQLQGESDDFASIDACLSRYVDERRISLEDALLFADDPYFLLRS